MTTTQNLLHLQEKIRQYELKYQRQPHSVKLIAVTKKQSLEKIREALAAGQIAFAENYLQEALPKITALADQKIEWHFIGSLQRNKTKKIAEYFQWVQTVDHYLMAERLNVQRPSDLPPLNICLQVNISSEATKSGVNPEETSALAQQCAVLPNIKLRGLMAIPAAKENFPEQRKQLQVLKSLFDHLCRIGFDLDTLSMGMSNDLEAAIAEGSTMVRVGTAIFGSRN